MAVPVSSPQQQGHHVRPVGDAESDAPTRPAESEPGAVRGCSPGLPAQLKCEDLCFLSSHPSLDCLTVFIINSKNFKGREEGRGEGGRREGREGRRGEGRK